jgi:fumarylacetoacetase
MIVEIPAGSPFPLENIPFGIISTKETPNHRPATALGGFAVDLAAIAHLFTGPLLAKEATRVFAQAVR